MFPPCWKLADLGPPDHPRRIGTVRYKLEKLARTWECGQGYKEFELLTSDQKKLRLRQQLLDAAQGSNHHNVSRRPDLVWTDWAGLGEIYWCLLSAALQNRRPEGDLPSKIMHEGCGQIASSTSP